MLLGRGGTAEPAIVGNIDEEIGGVDGKAANFVGKNRFVADEDAEAVPTGKVADGMVAAFAEAAYFVGETSGDTMDERERLVFAERDEMDFVVRENSLALWIEEDGAVVGSQCGVHICTGFRRRFPVDDSGEERMLKLNGEQRGSAGELRIFKGKRSRRFGPDEKIDGVIGRSEA